MIKVLVPIVLHLIFFFWPDLKYFVIRAIYKSYETGELSLIFQNKNNLGDNFMHYTIIHLILSY